MSEAHLDVSRLPCDRGDTDPTMRASSARPINPNQLVPHVARTSYRSMYSLRLSAEVWIDCANNDSLVIRGPVAVETKEMAAVER
jgi:hypothetical protein